MGDQRRCDASGIPYTDVVSFAFERQNHYGDEKALYINADNPEQCLTYSQTRKLVRQIIAGLRAAGLRRGEAVIVHLRNNYIYPSLFLGIVGAGGVFCGTNPAYRSEMQMIINQVQPRFIITSGDVLSDPDGLQKWAPQKSLRRVILVNSDDLHDPAPSFDNFSNVAAASLNSLLSYGESHWEEINAEGPAKNTAASYFLTSGTTGAPKLAMLSHFSMVAHFTLIHQEVPYEVVRLGVLPLFHMFGSAWAMALTIRYGEPFYIMPKYDTRKYLENIEKYQVTETFMAPPIVQRLGALPSADVDAVPDQVLRRKLSSLRYVRVGGAMITADTMDRLRGFMDPRATLGGVYGATEMGTIIMFRYGDQDATGSVGRPLPGVVIQIRQPETTDDIVNWAEKPHATCGEIYVSAPCRMMKYLHSSEKIEEWYRTGDLGRMDGDKLDILGKAKEIIKVNGFQVSPTEIEDILLKHPQIRDCAVTKQLKPNGSEQPRAYVVRRDRQLSRGDVFDFAAKQLASYKRLRGGVVFVREIPRLPSGKIQRHRLSEMSPDSNGEGRRLLLHLVIVSLLLAMMAATVLFRVGPSQGYKV